MDKNDKDTIIRSLPELTKILNLNPQFLALLQEYRVFSEPMIHDILRNETPKMEFCLMLVKRGPYAFGNFIRALNETDQKDVIRVLEMSRSRLDQPAASLIPSREINGAYDNGNGLGVNGLYQYSASPPTSADYWRKVLEPPNYSDQMTPLSPDILMRGPCSPPVERTVTDAVPPDWDNMMEIQVTVGTEIKGLGQDVYPNRHIKPRGLALILNFEEFTSDVVGRRVGSEKDVIHLDQLLQQLGYIVTIKCNLNLVDTINELDMFTKCEGHSFADSTIVAVMSHGKGGSHEEGTLIYTKDCRFLASEEVLRRFNNVNCPLLKGKPKIFLFQFCRGDNIDVGVRNFPLNAAAGRTVTDGNPVPPPTADIERAVDDMLIAYSTLPGYVSYREESEGTWFIKALCLIFMRDAHECHVDRLLQIVDKLIQHWTGQRNGKQTLEITRRGFNRKFYFNPGLWRLQ